MSREGGVKQIPNLTLTSVYPTRNPIASNPSDTLRYGQLTPISSIRGFPDSYHPHTPNIQYAQGPHPLTRGFWTNGWEGFSIFDLIPFVGCTPEEPQTITPQPYCRPPIQNQNTDSVLRNFSAYETYSSTQQILPTGPRSRFTTFYERTQGVDRNESEIGVLAPNQIANCGRGILEFYGLNTVPYGDEVRFFLLQRDDGSVEDDGAILLNRNYFRGLNALGVNPSTRNCYHGISAHEVAHWVNLPSVLRDFSEPVQARVLEEGHSQFWQFRLPQPIGRTASILHDRTLPTGAIVAGSEAFNACNNLEVRDVCSDAASARNRFACCASLYINGPSAYIFFEPTSFSLEFYLFPFFAERSPENSNQPQFFFRIYNRRTGESGETLPIPSSNETCASLPSASLSISNDPAICIHLNPGPMNDLTQGDTRLTLISNATQSTQSTLSCGSSSYQEGKRINLQDGTTYTVLDPEISYGVRTAPREMVTHSFQYISESGYNTGACFWDYIQTTYGMDAFRRVILHFRNWREEHPGQIEIDVIYEIANVLRRPKEEIYAIFRRFNLDSNWFTQQRVAPLCR